MLVVDASVACKWFIAEANSNDAEALLASGSLLSAPDLIVPEVCNVACLKLRRGEMALDQAAAMVDSLRDLFDELVPSVQLATRAFAIASTLAHPAYDCFYLALAELRGVRLVTADRRLVGRLATTPWEHVVVGLGQA
jgi:predicted nucleic acid-binding protein